ncbi:MULTISPECIES: DUF3868 domain-containing protein [Butyricimonas]|uniref:DUF3868 domain-containing protein n=1 Tax=Butyricimonas TaxID=574697 RepID=UPI0007FB271F|nr:MULTISPECIES: DUF3868 domain-containing protein [Butyricimonas]
MRKIWCLGLLMLFMVNVSGQELADGQVVVRNLDVVRGENALFVSMDVDVSALNIATNRELLFVPVLKGESDSVQLPFMIVAGRNRYFYHLRNTPVSDGDVLERAGQAKVIRYRASLPFESWMSKATLAIDERACGCRGEGEDRRVPLLRMEPKVYTPVFVYLPPEVEMVKTREVKGSAYIDFPVNRTEIHEDYRKNPTELRKIRQTIDVVREDPDVRITALSIKGYASPEGTYANNTRLAKGRTATLKTYVRELYHFPDSVILTSYEPEDWAGLEAYVDSTNLRNRDDILGLIRADLEPDAKEKMIKSTYPEDYQFLLKNVYPGLRHSDYVVRYVVRTYTDAEEIRRIMKTQPQKLSLRELYIAAKDLEPGSDEYNEAFEIAVRMFPADEIANLNAANAAMAKGDLKGAARYLGKAGDRVEAVYARGVYAVLSKDYDSAMRFFAEAAQGGITEAEDALRQVKEVKNDQIE